MKTLRQWLDEYRMSHQHPLNKKIHFICVPLIYFSILGLIWDIPFPWHYWRLFGYQPNWAIGAGMGLFVYYALLSGPIAAGMMVFTGACLFLLRIIDYRLSHLLPVGSICGIIFVLAWAGQFYGHKIEGKRPSFFKDVQFLLIGPAWLVSLVLDRMKVNY